MSGIHGLSIQAGGGFGTRSLLWVTDPLQILMVSHGTLAGFRGVYLSIPVLLYSVHKAEIISAIPIPFPATHWVGRGTNPDSAAIQFQMSMTLSISSPKLLSHVLAFHVTIISADCIASINAS